jgi:hypothetical protein
VTKKVLVSGWAEDAVLTEDNWRELEAAAGVTFLPQHRSKIVGAITAYMEDIAIYRASPRAAAVKSRLDEIAKTAAQLARLLSADKVGRGARRALSLAPRNNGAHNLSTLTLAIRQLSNDATAAGAACDNDTGREGDPYLGPLIERLHGIYRDADGVGKFTKPSLDFLQRACRLAGANIQSAAAFKQRVAATL